MVPPYSELKYKLNSIYLYLLNIDYFYQIMSKNKPKFSEIKETIHIYDKINNILKNLLNKKIEKKGIIIELKKMGEIEIYTNEEMFTHFINILFLKIIKISSNKSKIEI